MVRRTEFEYRSIGHRSRTLTNGSGFRCWDREEGDKHETLRFVCLYLPIILIIIFNAVCYLLITQELNREKRMIQSAFAYVTRQPLLKYVLRSHFARTASLLPTQSLSWCSTSFARWRVAAIPVEVRCRQWDRMAFKNHCDSSCSCLCCAGSEPSSIAPFTSSSPRSPSTGSTSSVPSSFLCKGARRRRAPLAHAYRSSCDRCCVLQLPECYRVRLQRRPHGEAPSEPNVPSHEVLLLLLLPVIQATKHGRYHSRSNHSEQRILSIFHVGI